MKRRRLGIGKIKNNELEILHQLDELQKQIDTIRENVIQSSSESKAKTRRKNKNLTISDYKTYFSWQDKIVFILKYQNKPMFSSEIVSFIDDFDMVFQDKTSELDKLKMLSTHLNRAVKRRVISHFKKTGVRGYYYCLPENLNNDPRHTDI